MTSVLHPWALWIGAIAAALPVAIHFLTKPKPTRYPLSTVKFLVDAVRQRKSRNRIRDLIILTLRTLAILLFALAVARPILDRQAVVAEDPAGTVDRVIILDLSQSMNAESHGVRTIDRARPAGAAYLSDRAGVRSAVILAGTMAEPVFDQLSVNTSALRTEVGRARVRSERLNVAAAIAKAAQLLGTSPEGVKRELVIVSDFQRTNWTDADFGSLPADVAIQLESVAPAEAPPNLAILRVSPPGRVEQGQDAAIEIEVGNFSGITRQVAVEVTAGDTISRVEGTCGAWGRTILTMEAPPRTSGWLTGQARLLDVNDSLAADNVRPFVLHVQPPPHFAMITRQPAASKTSSSYYLERAIEPVSPKSKGTGSRVVRIDPSQPDATAIAAADVLVIDHPGKLPPDLIRQIVELMKRGRGVLYVASEGIDATNLKLIAESAGADLKLPVEFIPPTIGTRRKDLILTSVRKAELPFSVFGDELPSVLNELRFGGGLATLRKNEGLADDLLASFSDRTAALVVTDCGEGALAIINTDLNASNLTASPSFVPIVGELVKRLLGRSGGPESFVCGEPIVVNLNASASPAAGLTLHGPMDDLGTLKEDSTGVTWSHPTPNVPGVYRIERQSQTLFATAVTVGAEESDLRTLGADVIVKSAGHGRSVGYRSALNHERERDTAWAWLAVGCVLCVLGEFTALKWFRI